MKLPQAAHARPFAWLSTLVLLAWLPAFALAPATPPAPPPATPPAGAAATQAPRAAPSALPAAPATTPAAPAGTAPKITVNAAATATAPPNGPEYDVEIIIFRARIGLGSPETWSAEAGERSSATISGGEAASGSAQVGQLVSVLPPSRYRLTPFVRRLKASGAYTPVAHAAWIQTASAWGTRAGFSLQSLGIDVPGLTGLVFLERGEFLHLGMQLDYTMQNPPPGLGAQPGTTFSINETRRVRFYQNNYYDHPAFGVIALVTPVKGPRAPGR
jgi:hypothetical protein